jgi:Lon protease-like protein
VARVFLPIFPLPDLTFFPHTLLPLHVFEARYRAMVIDCLARDKRMAIVGLKPGYEATYDGKPAVYEVAGMGRIVQCERFATGRFNLVVKGESRVRIERELPADTLYRLVAATPLSEVGADRPSVNALVAHVTARCLGILRAVKRPTAELEASLAEAAPGALCDQITSAVVPEAAVRQELLEELDIERRLSRLAGTLDDLFTQLTGER